MFTNANFALFGFLPNELAEQNSKLCKICISQHDALECNAFNAVFQIVQLPRDQKTALTRESLYYIGTFLGYL